MESKSAIQIDSSEQHSDDSVRASFEEWFYSATHRMKYTNKSHPVYLAAKEAFQAGLSANKWQPIETAPKDGFHILLYRPEIMFSGYWGGVNSGWRINAPNLPAMYPLPTHWQPLPTKP
jgi:hypothetical protein